MNNSSFFTNITQLCEITKSVTSSFYSGFYWSILAVEFVLCLTGISANVFLLILIKRSVTLHINIRLLFGHLTVTIVWFCSAIACRTLYIAITAMIDSCLLIMETLFCKALDLTAVLPLVGMIYIMAAIGIERIYASYKFHTYELKNSAVPAVMLMTIVWSICLLLQTYIILNIPSGKLTPLCMGLMDVKKDNALVLILAGATVEALASVCIVVNHYINKGQLNDLYINQAQHSLTARFQLHQNVKMNRMLSAIMLTHIVFWVVHTFYIIGALETAQLSILSRSCIMHFDFLMIIVYCNCNPIISVWHNVLLQKEMKKYSPKLYECWYKIYSSKIISKKVATVGAELNSIERYLQIMEQSWIRSAKQSQPQIENKLVSYIKANRKSNPRDVVFVK